jgi:hypothetical protein
MKGADLGNPAAGGQYGDDSGGRSFQIVQGWLSDQVARTEAGLDEKRALS